MTGTDTDPVSSLLKTARGTPVDEPFRVTGVMMQYYHICTRELSSDSLLNRTVYGEDPTEDQRFL